jgi:hypothetical protein
MLDRTNRSFRSERHGGEDRMGKVQRALPDGARLPGNQSSSLWQDNGCG